MLLEPRVWNYGIENYQARFAVPADVVDQSDLNEPVPVSVGDIDVAGTVTQRLPVRNANANH